MARELARVALVVGPLAALGPFAIDMYLPALPLVAATSAPACRRRRRR